jgi:hypothetical protein
MTRRSIVNRRPKTKKSPRKKRPKPATRKPKSVRLLDRIAKKGIAGVGQLQEWKSAIDDDLETGAITTEAAKTMRRGSKRIRKEFMKVLTLISPAAATALKRLEQRAKRGRK